MVVAPVLPVLLLAGLVGLHCLALASNVMRRQQRVRRQVEAGARCAVVGLPGADLQLAGQRYGFTSRQCDQPGLSRLVKGDDVAERRVLAGWHSDLAGREGVAVLAGALLRLADDAARYQCVDAHVRVLVFLNQVVAVGVGIAPVRQCAGLPIPL